jgi:Arc/MetJ family transcription regulator
MDVQGKGGLAQQLDRVRHEWRVTEGGHACRDWPEMGESTCIEGFMPRGGGHLRWLITMEVVGRCGSVHHSVHVLMLGGMMRTTVTLDDTLVARAQDLSGVKERGALLREALKALIEREAARRLARLGGAEPDLEKAPRRRPA